MSLLILSHASLLLLIIIGFAKRKHFLWVKEVKKCIFIGGKKSLINLVTNICVFYDACYLFGVGEVQFGCKVDCLHFNNVLFISEVFGHFPQKVRRDFWHMLTIFTGEPQNTRPCHGHLNTDRFIHIYKHKQNMIQAGIFTTNHMRMCL